MDLPDAVLLPYVMNLLYVLAGVGLIYVLATLFLTWLVQQIPRNPVKDPPRWGFTTVIHSARDHGNSSPKQCMNAVRFAEDIGAVMKWVNEPVLLYGHSAGSAGAIIAAARNPSMVRLLFLEASYAHTREALLGLYHWAHPVFGKLFGPVIVFWMDILYRGATAIYSPARVARRITMPVMIIHGEKDRRFPVSFVLQLKECFVHTRVICHIAQGAGHSDASKTRGYGPAVKSFIDRYLDDKG